ncbi:hypothetical protein AB0D04_06180 [Streptomyces sp. NPDC048483]|uniref:hypothetical protein n=1 Tax=Streptomyces sp. NPDC048483 TaxID=3154927 RepID=UPI003437BF79
MTQTPEPPRIPPIAHPAPQTPKSVTITFPVIRGKLAAFLYLTTLVLMGAIACAQIVQAVTARDSYKMYRNQMCSGTTYGAEDYTSDERESFEDMCGHPPRPSKD